MVPHTFQNGAPANGDAMTQPLPLKSVTVTALESGKPTLCLEVEGQEPFQYTVNRDQLFQLNAQAVDVLLKRKPQ